MRPRRAYFCVLLVPLILKKVNFYKTQRLKWLQKLSPRTFSTLTTSMVMYVTILTVGQCFITICWCCRLQVLNVHTQYDIRSQRGRCTPWPGLDSQEYGTARSPAHSAEDTFYREGEDWRYKHTQSLNFKPFVRTRLLIAAVETLKGVGGGSVVRFSNKNIEA